MAVGMIIDPNNRVAGRSDFACRFIRKNIRGKGFVH